MTASPTAGRSARVQAKCILEPMVTAIATAHDHVDPDADSQ
jgi:hypothetical protein